MRTSVVTLGAVVVFGLGFIAGHGARLEAQPARRVFEVRIATTPDRASLDVLMKRFAQGEVKIFQKHGMEPIGFWHPLDSPKSDNTMVYILAHASRDKAKESWAKFREDADFRALADRMPFPAGVKCCAVDSTYSEPLDFSPMK